MIMLVLKKSKSLANTKEKVPKLPSPDTNGMWTRPKGKKSWMFDHSKTCKGVVHRGANCNKNFRMNVVSRDKGALRRIIREAVLIKNAIEGETVKINKVEEEISKDIIRKVMLLNGKREFNLPTLCSNQPTNISRLM